MHIWSTEYGVHPPLKPPAGLLALAPSDPRVSPALSIYLGSAREAQSESGVLLLDTGLDEPPPSASVLSSKGGDEQPVGRHRNSRAIGRKGPGGIAGN